MAYDSDIGPTGVDQCAAITLKYPGERVAQLMCGFCLEPPKEAVVIGTKGTLKLPARFWCPTKLETPSVSWCTNNAVVHCLFVKSLNVWQVIFQCTA